MAKIRNWLLMLASAAVLSSAYCSLGNKPEHSSPSNSTSQSTQTASVSSHPSGTLEARLTKKGDNLEADIKSSEPIAQAYILANNQQIDIIQNSRPCGRIEISPSPSYNLYTLTNNGKEGGKKIGELTMGPEGRQMGGAASQPDGSIIYFDRAEFSRYYAKIFPNAFSARPSTQISQPYKLVASDKNGNKAESVYPSD